MALQCGIVRMPELNQNNASHSCCAYSSAEEGGMTERSIESCGKLNVFDSDNSSDGWSRNRNPRVGFFVNSHVTYNYLCLFLYWYILLHSF